MPNDEEAPDAVDVQPSPGSPEWAKSAKRPFPWVVLVVGIVAGAVIMAAITLSTIPLSVATATSRQKGLP